MAGPISTGLTTGIQLAQRQSELNLAREQHDFKMSQHEAAKTEAKGKFIKTTAATFKDVMGLGKAPGKAIYEQWAKSYTKIFGQVPDPSILPGLQGGSDEDKAGILSSLQAVTGLTDEELTPEVVDNLTSAIGQDRAIVGLKEFGKRVSAQKEKQESRIASKEELATREKGLEARQRVTIKQKQEEEKSKKITKLSDDVGKIDKEFSDTLIATQRIKGLVKLNTKESNAQIGVAVVRLASALSEARQSIVRESEFKTIASALPALDRLKQWAKSLVYTGKPIAQKTIDDLSSISNLVEKNEGLLKKARLTKSFNRMRQEGLDENFPSIFGSNQALFAKEFKAKGPIRGTERQLKTRSPEVARKLKLLLDRTRRK